MYFERKASRASLVVKAMCIKLQLSGRRTRILGKDLASGTLIYG
jgi:hypothetical protein